MAGWNISTDANLRSPIAPQNYGPQKEISVFDALQGTTTALGQAAQAGYVGAETDKLNLENQVGRASFDALQGGDMDKWAQLNPKTAAEIVKTQADTRSANLTGNKTQLETVAKKLEMSLKAQQDVGGFYQSLIDQGVNPQIAQQKTSEYMQTHLGELANTGLYTKDDMAHWPTQFDPQKFVAQYNGTKTAHERTSELLDAQRNNETKRNHLATEGINASKEARLIANAGSKPFTNIEYDDQGTPHGYNPNTGRVEVVPSTGPVYKATTADQDKSYHVTNTMARGLAVMKSIKPEVISSLAGPVDTALRQINEDTRMTASVIAKLGLGLGLQEQQLLQGLADFTAASLNQTSGAAITAGDVKMKMAQYGVTPGMDPAMWPQKLKAAEDEVRTSINSLHPRYRSELSAKYPVGGSQPSSASSNGAAKDPAIGMRVPMGDDDYRKNGKVYTVRKGVITAIRNDDSDMPPIPGVGDGSGR